MILRVFSVYDSKSESYDMPFYTRMSGDGIRMFSDAVKSPKSRFNAHPGDYTLFEIGIFDDNKGLLVDNNVHINHGNGLQYINENPPVPKIEVLQGVKNELSNGA